MSLSDKSAVILGGLGGIGMAICDEFLTQGIQDLAIIDIADPSEIIENNKFSSINFVFKQVSVENKDALNAAFNEINTKFGDDSRVNLVISCVGILNEMDYLENIRINLGGTITTTLSAIELMRQDKGGSGGQIITIASIASYTPMLAIPAFTGSFHGILGFIKSLAVEPFETLTGVEFVIVAPGITLTEMCTASVTLERLFPEFEELYQTVLKTMPVQSPKAVADCVVHALSCSNGQILECVGGAIKPI